MLIHSRDKNKIEIQETQNNLLLGNGDKLLYINEVRANYSKILGWTLKKAEQLKVYNP